MHAQRLMALLSQGCAHVMLVEESPEWRNWQTRWTQKRTSAACSNVLIQTQQNTRLFTCVTGKSARPTHRCSFFLIVGL